MKFDDGPTLPMPVPDNKPKRLLAIALILALGVTGALAEGGGDKGVEGVGGVVLEDGPPFAPEMWACEWLEVTDHPDPFGVILALCEVMRTRDIVDSPDPVGATDDGPDPLGAEAPGVIVDDIGPY